MKLWKAVTTVCCMAVIGAICATSAAADEWNRKTAVTFSGPVEIPGVHLAGWGVLPAGTPVFKILDSQSDQIVQIFRKEEVTIHVTPLSIRDCRLGGEPEALHAWFYPGRNWGEEFVYPKAKAIALAKATNTPVLFTPGEIRVEVGRAGQISVRGGLVELKRAAIVAINRPENRCPSGYTAARAD